MFPLRKKIIRELSSQDKATQDKKRGNSMKIRFSNSCMNKEYGSGKILEKEEKQSLCSCMRNSMLTFV